MAESKRQAPITIQILSVILLLFGLFAFMGSLFTWGQGFIFNFPHGVDLAFPITDLIVNAPASIVAAIGLWKLKRVGFVSGYFVSGFYIYASVEIFVRVFQAGAPYKVEILVPQIMAVMVAVALLVCLRGKQHLFFSEE